MPPKTAPKTAPRTAPNTATAPPMDAHGMESSQFAEYLKSEPMTANLTRVTDPKICQSYYNALFLDSGAILKYWGVPYTEPTDDEETKLMKKLDQHDVFDLEVLIRLANRQIDICMKVAELRADDQVDRQAEDPDSGNHIKITKDFQEKATSARHWMAMLQKIQKAKHFNI